MRFVGVGTGIVDGIVILGTSFPASDLGMTAAGCTGACFSAFVPLLSPLMNVRVRPSKTIDLFSFAVSGGVWAGNSRERCDPGAGCVANSAGGAFSIVAF